MLELKAGGYRFFTSGPDENIMNIEYQDGAIITLETAKIEMVGMTPMVGSTWEVALLTDAAIKKLKYQITEQLELISFNFQTFKDAVACVSFLTLANSNKLGLKKENDD